MTASGQRSAAVSAGEGTVGIELGHGEEVLAQARTRGTPRISLLVSVTNFDHMEYAKNL
jgi:hypothetical protein